MNPESNIEIGDVFVLPNGLLAQVTGIEKEKGLATVFDTNEDSYSVELDWLAECEQVFV